MSAGETIERIIACREKGLITEDEAFMMIRRELR